MCTELSKLVRSLEKNIYRLRIKKGQMDYDIIEISLDMSGSSRYIIYNTRVFERSSSHIANEAIHHDENTSICAVISILSST